MPPPISTGLLNNRETDEEESGVKISVPLDSTAESVAGALRSVVEPYPIRPSPPSPQHMTLRVSSEVLNRAQEVVLDSETATSSGICPAGIETATGVAVMEEAVPPSPNSPDTSVPQHSMAEATTMQACSVPTETE